MRVRSIAAMLAAFMLLAAACSSSDDGSAVNSTTSEAPQGEDVTLIIESWRVEDTDVWEDTIIPAFEAANPGIKLSFKPTVTPEYPAALSTRLEGGNAGDLITCRPFDDALGLYDQGHLLPINDLAGLDHYSSAALSAWQTLDGENLFCLPMAAVGHGFMYNVAAFKALGVEPPTTMEEFDVLLDAIAADGTYTPLAMGATSEDGWYPATLLYQNLGPNYWNGEEGRLALIDGSARYTDPEHIAVFNKMIELTQYMPVGFEGVGYTDSQNLFALEQAAIFPAGSWEINWANTNADFEIGVFPPPPAADATTCYIDNHVDMGLGINPASDNVEAARKALEWFAGAEFAQLFTNALPGFFALADHEISVDDPIAATYASWSGECESTIRNTYAVLNSGDPSLIDDMWRVVPLILTGEMTPEEGTAELETGLASWYEPHQ